MRKFVLLAAAAGAGLPALAQAQEAATDAVATDTAATDDSGVTDIIVTANRREESLQKVPLAVTALGAQELAAKGVVSLTSLATTPSPGLVVVKFAGAATTLSVNMRGVSTPSPADGLVEQGVAIYSDGVPIGRATGAGIELADIERVEILRGPQGQLFGRNAEGGAVQYISKRPTGDFGGKVEAQVGNYNEQRVLGQIEFPVMDNLAVKLGGLISKHDGYTKNLALRPGDTMSDLALRDFDEFNQKGFRVAALWTPTDDFDAYYTYDFANTKYTNGYTLRRGGRTPSEPAFCSNPVYAANCATSALLGANIYQGTRGPDVGFISRVDVPTYQPGNEVKTRGHALTLTYRASPDLTFKSITGYRTNLEDSLNNLGTALPFVQLIPTSAFDGIGGNDVATGTLGGVSGSIADAYIDQKQFSQEFQVVGSTDTLEYTGGLFYFYEAVNDTRESFFNFRYLYQGTPGVLVPYAATPFQLGPSRVQYHGRADSYAAYGQATWTVPGTDDRLKLTGGLRYTNDKKVFVRKFYLTAADNSHAQFKDDRFDPAFTIAFQVTPEINVYGRYASAYRAGGVPIRNKLALTTYGAEVNKSFELGIKTQLLDRKVRFNLAAFRSRVSGLQASVANIITDPSSQDYVNIPETVKIWGFETELTVAPVRGLTLSVNYGYLDVDGPATINTVTGPRGFRPPNAPKHTLTLNGDYEMPLSGDMSLLAHADYSYISNYTLSPLIQPFTQNSPMGLKHANARLGIDGISLGGSKNLYVGVYGRNIFDVEMDAFAFNTGTNDFTVTPGGAANALPPRTYGAEVRFRF